jgi:hypothetical protein
MEDEATGTLVGVESPRPSIRHGGTPTLGLRHVRTQLYHRGGNENEPVDMSPISNLNPDSFDDYLSPPRHGLYASSAVASLEELYYSPVGGFHLDKSLVKMS